MKYFLNDLLILLKIRISFEEIFGYGIPKLEVDLKWSFGSPEVVVSIQG